MDQSEISQAIAAYELAKAAEAEATSRRQDAQDRVATLLEVAGRKTVVVEVGDRRLRVTRSAPAYVKSVDEKGLKRFVGAKVWNKITVRKFSEALLKQAITDGLVDGIGAAQYIETGTKRPSLTVSEAKDE
jgi:hypothetical protein